FARQRSFIQALQAIVTGSRDRTLADAPDFHGGRRRWQSWLVNALGYEACLRMPAGRECNSPMPRPGTMLRPAG
ncbi:MAG: hypothetical protein RKO24_16790, partial [Candidatus Competibacter sp.]|nr:hypothetical protein [Candidatus Competibacter sp.]